jgi:hypothetical protein
LMVWYYFKFFKYLFIQVPDESKNDFYDIALSKIYQLGQTKVSLQTWCQLKIPILIWNWFLIFYTFYLLLFTLNLIWYGLLTNLWGTTAMTEEYRTMFPLRSSTEWSMFDITFNDQPYDYYHQ